MKKHIYVLALTMLLCGCVSQQVPPEETVLTTTQPEEIVETQDTETTPLETVLEVDLKTGMQYGDFKGFLRSDFYKKMQQDGFTTYALSYDKDRFVERGMSSDACFYTMGFDDKNKPDGWGVVCTITYNAYEKTAEELAGNKWDTSGDSIVTVEKDGVNYDVYISKTPLVDYDEYSIAYIPFEGYTLDIHASASTPEEALAYIHEFDLVPVEEGTVTTEVTVESDTAP